jgi:hypothetical protein
MNLPLLRVILTLGALLLCNCAAINPSMKYQSFGEVDVQRERDVLSKYRELRDTSEGSAAKPEVKVLVDTMPEGLELKDGILTVTDGYSHEIVGKFTLGPGRGAGVTGVLWFADYKSVAHKVACYPQVLLTWVTMGIWFLSPTSYVCWGNTLMEKEELIDHLKVIARSAGGDLVMTSISSYEPETAYGASGFIIKRDPNSQKSRPQKLAPSHQSSREAPGPAGPFKTALQTVEEGSSRRAPDPRLVGLQLVGVDGS